jgi:hypothetical protein
MPFVTSPPHSEPETTWPFRRAVLLWVAVSAALWVPIAIGAYWLVRLG